MRPISSITWAKHALIRSIKDLTELVDPWDAKNVQQQLSKAVLETKLTYGCIQGSEKLKETISQIYNDDYEWVKVRSQLNRQAWLPMEPLVAISYYFTLLWVLETMLL